MGIELELQGHKVSRVFIVHKLLNLRGRGGERERGRGGEREKERTREVQEGGMCQSDRKSNSQYSVLISNIRRVRTSLLRVKLSTTRSRH
jgi:hypothetical protein